MKSRSLSLFLSLSLLTSAAQAQSVLFREKGVAVDDYRAALSSSFARQTPMSLLEKRLQNEELPSFLQAKLDETLLRVAQHPDQANEAFETYYRLLVPEPRSAAIRETMKVVLERLLSSSSAEARGEIQKRLDLLARATESHVVTKPSLIQREVQEKLRRLRQMPGGEDLELFWNGVRFSENLPLAPDQQSQWIVVSSQWQPRLLDGTWSEVSARFDNDFADWVIGTCADPQYRDFALDSMSDHQALFTHGCLAGGTDAVSKTELQNHSSSVTQLSNNGVNPWLAGAGLMAVGALLLMASGKKLQIHRN